MGSGNDERDSKANHRHHPEKRVTLKALSWQEHIAQGHVPFRRDCAVCQRAAAKDRPHRASPCVLALDLTGPFVLGTDIDGDPKKYLLVGAYTWPVMDEAPWDEQEDMVIQPEWPRLEEEEAMRDVIYDPGPAPEEVDDFSYRRPNSDETEDEDLYGRGRQDFGISSRKTNGEP